jgi:hypothetical protein
MKPPLRLFSTDLSHIVKGEVSISHSLKLLKPHDDTCPSGSAAYSLRTAGFKLVKQLGCWFSHNHSLAFIPYKLDDILSPTSKKLTTATRKNWNRIITAMAKSTIDFFFFDSTDLLIPRLQCRDAAEDYIISLALTCKFSPSSLPHNNSIWATDGSMNPAASSIGDFKSITATVSGPASIIMRVAHRNASILQGEQMGLVSALVLAEKLVGVGHCSAWHIQVLFKKNCI